MKYSDIFKIIVFVIAASASANAQEQKRPSERSYEIALKTIKDQVAARKALRSRMQIPVTNVNHVSDNYQSIQTRVLELNNKPVLINTKEDQKRPSERLMPQPVRKENIRE